MNHLTLYSAALFSQTALIAHAEIVTVQYTEFNAPDLLGTGTYNLPELGTTLYSFDSGHGGFYNLTIQMTSDIGHHYFALDLGEVGTTYFNSNSTTYDFRYGNGGEQMYDDPAWQDLIGEPGEMSYVLFGLGRFEEDNAINGYFQLLNVDDDHMLVMGYSFNTDLTGGITVRNLPAPGAVSILGLAGLTTTRRRRS